MITMVIWLPLSPSLKAEASHKVFLNFRAFFKLVVSYRFLPVCQEAAEKQSNFVPSQFFYNCAIFLEYVTANLRNFSVIFFPFHNNFGMRNMFWNNS